MRATIRIMPKAGVHDPQGEAIRRALGELGYGEAREVRQGKLLTFEFDAPDAGKARARVEEMCAQLLANPIIEDYEIDVTS